MKRVLLFVGTNVAVLVVLSIAMQVLGNDYKFSLNVSDGDSAALCRTEDGYSYVLMSLARDRVAKSA